MRKLVIPAVAAMAIGSLIPQAQAAPAMPGTVAAAHGADVVKVGYFCGPGRHLGPLGYCRANTAAPLFRLRCAPGFHRNFFGRCVINR